MLHTPNAHNMSKTGITWTQNLILVMNKIFKLKIYASFLVDGYLVEFGIHKRNTALANFFKICQSWLRSLIFKNPQV
jgi:hypothetical protein